MLSYETRSKLGAFLLSVSAGEQEIEKDRQNLCKLQDFEPYAAFQRLEKRPGCPLTSDEIRDFLAEQKIYHSNIDCDIFIKRFDTDSDFALSFGEFLNALLPTDNPHLRSVTTQRMNYRVSKNQILKPEIEVALAKLIDREISFYLNRDLQKARLIQQKDFTFQAAFTAIDKYYSERIDYDNLKSFLEGQAMYPTRQDLVAILRKIDRQNKGFISLTDLMIEINPVTDLSQTNSVKIQEKSYKTTIQDLGISFSAKKEGFEDVFIKNEVSFQKPFAALDLEIKDQIRSSSLEGEKVHHLNNNSEISTQIGSSHKTFTPLKEISKFETTERTSQQKAFRNVDFISHNKNTSINGLDQTAVKDNTNPQVVKTLNFTDLKEKNQTEFQVNRTNLNLISSLKQILAFEKELETAKENLALRQDFNIFSFFRTFNPELNAYVAPNLFLEGLKRYSVFPNYSELELVFKGLDKDQDGNLIIRDFEDMLLSRKYEFSIMVRNRAPVDQMHKLEVDKIFTSGTRGKIFQVLSLTFENAGLIDLLKKKLNKTTFDYKLAFDQLDINQEGFATLKTMKSFLESNDWYITNEDLSLLMDIFDSNKDGKVSYDEFIKTLSIKY